MSKAILTHIASRLLNVPLMISPDKLEALFQVLGPRIGLTDFPVSPPAAVTDFSRRPQYREYSGDGIGLIPVMGPLAYNVSLGDALCSDIVSYRDIRDMFREALADPLIESILFQFDSPGGEVAGVFDLADEIYNARAQKPIYAIIDESAFSAAYALASAASTIFVPRTGGAGSIGVIATFVDQSDKDKKDGLKYISIFSGARKNDFNPHNPLSSEALARLQSLVDEDYKIFVETIARNRGMTVDAVIGTEAGIFQGGSAVEAGLADQVMNFDQAVRYVESRSQTGGTNMRIFGRRATVAPAAEEANGRQPEEKDVIELDALLENARNEGYEHGRAQAIKEAIEAVREEEMARISAIFDRVEAVSAHLTGPFAFAASLVKEGISAEDASNRIISAVADKSASEAPDIKSTVSSTGSGEANPLLEDARKRREKLAGKI